MNHNSAKYGFDNNAEILVSSFRKKPVSTLGELRKIMKVSRRTVFRTLRHVGCLSSFSHAGKFYTLDTIPSFNTHGLWFHRDIGFSKHGTLRATIVLMVNEAPGGCTHEELQAILLLKVYNTLHDLARDQLIVREQIDYVYVYFATDPKVAEAQVARRKATTAVTPMMPVKDRPLGLADVVEILLVVIRKQSASIRQISAILGAKGLMITDQQVEDVLDQYDLKKKKKNSLSKYSKK